MSLRFGIEEDQVDLETKTLHFVELAEKYELKFFTTKVYKAIDELNYNKYNLIEEMGEIK